MRRLDLLSRVLMTLLLLTVACSTDSTQSGAQLSLVIGNTDVRSVRYDIVCDGGATFSSEFEVVDDRDPPVWETFVGLPAGQTCLITLTAFDEAGNPICTGSTSVDIVEGQTVKANIIMECPTTGEPAKGSVEIDGRFEDIVVDICPIIHILNAIPRTITELPGESSLRVQASDPDGDAVETVLSATSGDIADPNATRTTFTCTQGGSVEVTVTAAPGNPSCQSTATTTLSCPDTGGPCDGVTCEDDGEPCTTESCNPATGQCESSNVEDWTVCGDSRICGVGVCRRAPCKGAAGNFPDGTRCLLIDVGPGSCMDGVCSPIDCAVLPDGAFCNFEGEFGICVSGVCGPDPCADALTRCDDGNECTQDLCDRITGVCLDPEPLPNSEPCDGGNGVCQFGVCGPDPCADAATRCDDGNECTSNSCDPATFECLNPPAGGLCEGGVCDSGACIPFAFCDGVPDGERCFLPGGDNNAIPAVCRAGVCVDPLASCDCAPDGRLCKRSGEGPGACLGGVCVDAPSTCDAPDGSVCSGCLCFPLQRCSCRCTGTGSIPAPTGCEGEVVDGPVGPFCNDSNECTVDACAPTGNCENAPVANGTPCNDGAGTCQGGDCQL